jgi:crotonobetaine/carnitine-CoA ligase
LNVYLKGEFLRYQLQNSQVRVAIVDRPGLDSIGPLLGDLPHLQALYCFDDVPDAASGAGGLSVQSFRDILPPDGVAELPEVQPEDIVAIIYTSGTTGLPKGCLLSHGYSLRAAYYSAVTYGLTADDIHLNACPFFHASSLTNCLGSALVVGCSSALELTFSPQGIVRRAAEIGATMIGGVGAHGSMILGTPVADIDRSTGLRLMFFVPCPPDAQQVLMDRFDVDVTAELYGQTECFPVSFSPLAGPRNRASSGRAAPDLRVAIVDEHGEGVAPGVVGEIVLQPLAPHAMFSGYWDNQKATAAAFRDGWYHTGDAGRLDEDGFLSFVDRYKDALRRRGENVSSIELENAIGRFPKIADVAVYGVPSPLGEDDIVAAIVMRDGEATSPEELFGLFRSHLPYFAIPRYVRFMDALPRNGVGRIMKQTLRANGEARSGWDFQALGFEVPRDGRRAP